MSDAKRPISRQPPEINVDVEAVNDICRGMDFADALHLGAVADCEAMLTFDRMFIKAARSGRLGPGETPMIRRAGNDQ